MRGQGEENGEEDMSPNEQGGWPIHYPCNVQAR